MASLKQNGVLASDTKHKAEILNNMFNIVFTKDTSAPPSFTECPFDKIPNSNATYQDSPHSSMDSIILKHKVLINLT